MNAPEFEFTEQMNEISGYGGMYERACRIGVRTGAQWFASHLHAHPEFGQSSDTASFIQPLNEEGYGLLAAIEEADFVRDDGVHVPLAEQMTREMMSMVLFHTLYIAKKGWNNYMKKMTAPIAVLEEDEA